MKSNQSEDDTNRTAGDPKPSEAEPGTQSGRIDYDEHVDRATPAPTNADHGIHSPTFGRADAYEDLPSARLDRTSLYVDLPSARLDRTIPPDLEPPAR